MLLTTVTMDGYRHQRVRLPVSAPALSDTVSVQLPEKSWPSNADSASFGVRTPPTAGGVAAQAASMVPSAPSSSAVTATSFAIYHFAFAIVAYIIHGATRDTDNQFRPPHTLGKLRLAKPLVHFLMWSLVISEIGGAGLLFWGFMQTQILGA